jgi:hypothetical protein
LCRAIPKAVPAPIPIAIPDRAMVFPVFLFITEMAGLRGTTKTGSPKSDYL